MRALRDLLDTHLWGGYSVQDLLVAVAIIWLAGAVLRRLKGHVAGKHSTARRCGCGWRGNVSRHNARCPHCGIRLA